ncbi:hypothetical protein EDD11_002699 [Mortierella claussenii]|nr:hypothetical protein EDD11_002699 [Mortierella claussenii]
MVQGPLSSNPVIDTRPVPLARQDSQGPSFPDVSHTATTASKSTNMSLINLNHPPGIDNNTLLNSDHTNGSFKHSTIPEHSSLPSPLSPSLSVSPPSFGPSMADFMAPRSSNGSLTASLPPLHPSTQSHTLDHYSHSTNHIISTPLTQQHLARGGSLSTATPPYVQTEAWVAHAAQQRRHLSTGSFSSTSSSTSNRLSLDDAVAQSPSQLEFGESERVQEQRTGQNQGHGQDQEQDEDQEPELNVFVRPSELRASLMARARRSSAKMQQKRSESMPIEKSSRYNSIGSSTYDSHISARSSVSSSISGWAPRARSSSVSSQASNDSVNLDALIAEGSDINEECPLELEEGDDVEWSKGQQQVMPSPASTNGSTRTRNTTAESEIDMRQYDVQDMDEFWGNSEAPTEEDEEFDETLREFSRMAVKSSIAQISGLSMNGDIRAGGANLRTSSRFADGRNPFDLEADYMDTHMGLRTTDRNSIISNQSNSSISSSRSSTSRLPSSGASRLPGAPGASGLKAPTTRLAQPTTRSMLAQSKTATSVQKTGIVRPSGLQAPRTGSQAAKSGIQAPRSGSQVPRTGFSSTLTSRGSSIAKPGISGIATPGRTTAINSKAAPTAQRKVAAPSRLPSTSTAGAARPGTAASRSQVPPPNSIKKSAVTTANRQSLLLAPSTISRNGANGRTAGNISSVSPKRTQTSPSLLSSPTRMPSDRQLNSPYMISPTSSQSSTSSLQSPTMGNSGRDTVIPLSQRLSHATGTSQLARPKTSGTLSNRSVSMYGSSSLLPHRDSSHQHQYQHQEDNEGDYAVLTPPQSPSSLKTAASRNVTTGIPRSGIVPPSRLAAPSVSTTRPGRAISPSPLSAGSNSGGQGLMLPRSHTPTSSTIPLSRMSSGLVSPRAGRH